MSSLEVVAAICGNFWQESGINPSVWESLQVGTWTDLRKGYGLGQWTNVGTSQGRLYRLHEWITSNGYNMDDGNAQVEYLKYENYWTPRSDYPQFPTLDSFLTTNITDLELLTHTWNLCWEGIHDATWDARVGYAQQCLTFLSQNYNNPSIVAWYSGNRYLGINERLNNSVMVYKALSGITPPTPPQPTPSTRRKMPVWMMIRRM